MIHAESLNNDKSSIVWHHMGLGGTKCLRKQLAFGPKVQYFLELNSKKKKKKNPILEFTVNAYPKKKKMNLQWTECQLCWWPIHMEQLTLSKLA